MRKSTQIVLESVLETQLKFKILHSYTNLPGKDDSLSCYDLRKIFLKLIYTITLKKVLSSKLTNRIVLNYFKKFATSSIANTLYDLEKNKNLIELEYLYTLAINNLYEVSSVRNHD